MNFNFVTARIAVGSAPSSPDDIVTLLNYGITGIINLYEVDDTQYFGICKFAYLHNPTPDDGTPKPTSWFKESIEFGLSHLSLTNTKLYCHCQAGINRGPSTAYAIMRAGYSLLSEDTLLLIRKHRLVDIVGVRYASDAEAALKEMGYA